MGKIMALDIGSVRIGVAMTDELRIIASPHSVIKRNGTDIDVPLKIAITARIDLIVCGLPVGLNGQETPQTAKTRDFIEHLRAKTDVEVVAFDERLTTKEAEEMLIARNYKREERRKIIDKVAACLILESYLRRKTDA